MIEIRTGNSEIGMRTWQVNVTWEQRREVFTNDAIQVVGRENQTAIEVDSTRLFASLPASALGTTDEELWATPYAQLQELALKVGLWLWTGIEPDRVEVEEHPLASTNGAGRSPERSRIEQGSGPQQRSPDRALCENEPAENPMSSTPPATSGQADSTTGPTTMPGEPMTSKAT